MNPQHIISQILPFGMTATTSFFEPGVGGVVVFGNSFASQITHAEFVLRVFVTGFGSLAVPFNGNLIMVFEIAAEGLLAAKIPAVDL